MDHDEHEEHKGSDEPIEKSYLEGDPDDPDAPVLASPDIDPLAALLAVKVKVGEIRETYQVPIVGGGKIPWTVKVLDDETMDDLREEATSMVKRQGQRGRVQELDYKKFQRLIVVAATVSPDLNNRELHSKHNVQRPVALLHKILLPGTIVKLADAVTDLGGYDEEALVEVGKD